MKVILAGDTGKSWLQRNWRPLLLTVIIIASDYLLTPYLSAMLRWGAVIQ
ncbi:hypothetical protein ACFO0U_11275 [Chromohalobacter sarecensis]|uniref:Uncharacterized protein n=1 Tax=Chromohalobacter sarecensis TaxID=245294 RepID=A0ABV9D3J9_9GAMM|nr:hypothetical protein [Chromohalobacter sarecensis]MCK0714520.1 hypothetical protein [Chromohalobacter sarecensis]